DLTRGSLLLKASPEFTVSRLHLLEQARVLDGNDGLVGKGLQQFDVPGGKGTGFRSGDNDRANGRIIAEHRHRKVTSPATSGCEFPREQRISQHVLDLCYGAAKDGATGDLIRLRWPRIHSVQDSKHLSWIVVVGGKVHEFAVVQVHRPLARAAESHRVGS